MENNFVVQCKFQNLILFTAKLAINFQVLPYVTQILQIRIAKVMIQCDTNTF